MRWQVLLLRRENRREERRSLLAPNEETLERALESLRRQGYDVVGYQRQEVG